MPTSDSTLGISGCWLDLPGSVRSAGQEWVHCSDDTIRGATDGPQVHPILHVVLLQLGQDVLAVGVLSKRRDVWPDLKKTVCVTWAREATDVASTFPDTDCMVHISPHKGILVFLLPVSQR